MTNLVANLRSDLGDPNLPFVAGEIKSSLTVINDQINQLPGLVPFTGVASSAGLTLQDTWHFDSPSQKLLGQRYATEMQSIHAQLSNQPKLSLIHVTGSSVTLDLIDLNVGMTLNILHSPSLTSLNWTTGFTFTATAETTNWTHLSTEPSMFYKLD